MENEPAPTLSTPVPLDPELEGHLYESEFMGAVLKHPLVFMVPYSPVMNQWANEGLRQKKEQLERAIDKGNWETVIWLHERPYRPYALLAHRSAMPNDTYWHLARQVWMDTESLHQWEGLVEALLADERGGKQALMDDDDRAFLDSLPDPVTVHRGWSGDHDPGWSWTTDEAKAEWFARRFDFRGEPIVATGQVPKGDIIFALVGRGESEIVVDPECVEVLHLRVLKEA